MADPDLRTSAPRFDRRHWDFRVCGLVDEPNGLTYAEFMALPKTKITADIHCVTTWSLLGSEFEGVHVRELLKHVKAKPEATFVMHTATATRPTCRSRLLDDECCSATAATAKDLTPDHGWPLRLVVPKRYFWKSAKWVRGLEFMAKDSLGFWEKLGYNNNADPWLEERFS